MNELPRVALSVKQPWSWLILRPDLTDPDERRATERDGLLKDIENRDWKLPRTICGKALNLPLPILIHAGKSFDKDGYEYVKRRWPEIPLPQPNEFERGGIVGRIEIIGCVDNSPSKWFFGRYGFVLRNAQPLPFRALPGQLGFFVVPPE